MGKREKVMFTIFVVIVQVLQFLLVYSIAWLNNRTIEFLFIFFSFQMNRMVFGKSYHADSLSKCTLITLVTFYLLIKGVIPLNISLFATPLFGVYLSYVLNIIQELIDNQEVPKPFVKKRLREQIIEILGEDLSEEHINEICRAKGINPKVAETVYLYIDNSKDEVADILDIPGDYIIGVESDEKSDRMYFQCPKIVGDNVDLSKLKLYVNFENANKERDNYFVDDVTVNEGNILFSWLFSRKVTKYKGDVKFIVCAKKSEDNLTLEWNTTVAKGLSLEGIEVELSDEEQSIASDYLIQLEKELSALAETENNRLLTTSSNQITNITNKGSEQVQLVENTAKKALDSIPSTYTDLQKQVNEVEDRELKDANGITQELTITDGYAQLIDTATKRLNSLVIKGNTVQESTSGKPSPSPEYPQEIKAVNELSGVMSGKNLLKPYGSYPITANGITFNLMNDGIHVNGKCTRSNCRTFIYSDTLQAGTYYINGIKGASNSRYQVVLYKNNVILNYITTKNFKLELKEKAKIELSLFVYSEYGTFNDLVLPYMICRNENDLYLYTPYQGQSLLNYTLQNPLYKIGDVYDYIDFNRGKIIRNVGVVTFDGSDDELWNKYSNNVSMDGYSVNVSNAIDTTPCICNKLLTTDAISTTLEEAIKVLDNAMYVVLNKIRGLNTTELFKSWLQSNPITVCYQLATPTEKDIPQELLTQLKQLQTYSGKTNISFEASDVYPTIDLEYIKDTKKYIESKEELDNQSIIDIDYRVTCLELDMEEQ